MTTIDSPATNAEFQKNERELRKNRAIAALSMGVLLMPAGLLPDWILYGDSFTSLFAVRMISTVFLGTGLFVIWKLKLDRGFEPLSFSLIFSPAIAMAVMMYLTDGGQSTYYFGLILLMIVVHLLGFRTSEAVVFAVLTVAIYLLAVFSHPAVGRTSSTELTQGVFFLVTSAVVCVVVSHYSRSNRWAAFQLQNELRNERIQLEQSMIQLRETESQLFQSEKVRAVAGLASGLLHEINNPVNFSLMAVRVLKKRLAGMDSELETLGDIEDGVDRIGAIVTDLRSFAYPDQEETLKPFVLRSAIDTAIRFSVNEIESGGIHQVDTPAMDSIVLGAEGQIVQVFLNLIVNATRALRKKPGAAKHIEIEATQSGERITVEVRDWGIGMSVEKLATVLEPSALERTGEGLGLGLSICQRIVQSHGGQLVVRSQEGEGTQVAFDLPVNQKQREQIAMCDPESHSMKQNNLQDREGAAR